MGYRVRAPTPGDADVLGRIHVRAWQAAYRGGLMPDGYLDALSEADRAAMWRQRLEHGPAPRSSRLVAEAEDASVVGFIVVGPAEAGRCHVPRQPEVATAWFPVNDHPVDPASYSFEVTVPDGYEVVANGYRAERRPGSRRAGVGCDLLATGVAALTAFGFARAVLWVHPGNVGARRFYEVHSWFHDGLARQQARGLRSAGDGCGRAALPSDFARAVLWVHPGNVDARRFYEVHSWSHDGLERQQEVLGVVVPETRYSRSLP